MSTLESHRSRDCSGQASKPLVHLDARDLGQMSYAEAYAVQKQLQQDVIDARQASGHSTQMHLLLVEHDPPVITVSRRPGARQHLIATETQLRAAGVEVAETDRGGDITYHGPGQLVVYPILDLNVLNLRLIGYLRFLEQIIIAVLARFGIQGMRDERATGVWIAPREASGSQSAAAGGATARGAAKIAAIGVRVSRWVTMHGLALNENTNLDHFNLIVPCGLAGRSVTSMEQELETRCPNIEAVKAAMIEQFRCTLGRAGFDPAKNSL
jgi:lipoyl(octanoyl) transferase